jgi:hypothetical protein
MKGMPPPTMNTLQNELHNYAFHLLISSVQACISLIANSLQLSMATQPSSQAEQLPPAGLEVPNATKKAVRWSEEEITDLVDFLYEHRSEGSAGNFKAKTFKALARHLSSKRPDRPRSADTIQNKYRSVSSLNIKYCIDLLTSQ